ncbi:MAG: right-handed parallel beta-helix repeat-containing protein [Deltaproteobacteria bacterium]
MKRTLLSAVALTVLTFDIAFAERSIGDFGERPRPLPVNPTDPTETAPNRPRLFLLWKSDSAARIRWTDQSDVESGFTIARREGSGAWIWVADEPALAGNYLSDERVVGGLRADADHCLRIVAYRDTTNGRVNAAPVEVCTHTPARSCDGTVLDDLLEPAGPTHGLSVTIDCDLHLEPGQVVTKSLHLVGAAASGVEIDLNGARLFGGSGTANAGKETIVIRSDEVLENATCSGYSTYSVPRDIRVAHGEIIGSIRVWGMAMNGEGQDIDGNDAPCDNQLLKSSNAAGHTGRARANAPTDIVFEDLRIVGTGRNPFYLAPGVQRVTLRGSELTGESNAVAIYMDAESGNNRIEGNVIRVRTNEPWYPSLEKPLIAIDGSSDNKIVNNFFAELAHGGIYLYRNCGDEGVVRHQTPTRNHIVNNRFYYVSFPGTFAERPAVYLSSRDWPSWWRYCGDDAGLPFGSSASDRDHATHNVVMQNQFYENPVSEMVVTNNPAVNSPNFVAHNTTVTEASVDATRLAGCYITDEAQFILHGASYDVALSSQLARRYTCTNGDLSQRLVLTGTGVFF